MSRNSFQKVGEIIWAEPYLILLMPCRITTLIIDDSSSVSHVGGSCIYFSRSAQNREMAYVMNIFVDLLLVTLQYGAYPYGSIPVELVPGTVA
jgi:hypothetical protein